MFALLGLTAFLILGNGFFVAAEFALVKVRSTQLDVRAAQGDRLSGLARSLLEHLDGYLSATQLGITLTSLGLGWIGEPAVASVLAPAFHALHVSEELAHRISVGVGFAIISALHIVVGEVAPKSLAIARPVEVVRAISAPMRAFYIATYPALVVLNAASNALLRLFGIEPAGTHSLAVPSDELVRIVEESAAGGTISRGEGSLVSNVFAFSHRTAHQIMVPRNKVFAIDLDEPIGPQLNLALENGHSRFPVFNGELDRVLGVIHLKDLLLHDLATLESSGLQPLIRQPLFVPNTLPAEKVMRRMQARKTHLALVVDEHGGVDGLVTLEDTLEELVGQIQDEYDDEGEEIQSVDGGFITTGGVLLDELGEAIGEAFPTSDADTLQGWLMEVLERVPRADDSVTIGTWTVRVVQVEARAVQRAELVKTVVPPPPPTPEA